jgi:xylulose-5-phosphate/fructose-6-phosphate phosphoketolase
MSSCRRRARSSRIYWPPDANCLLSVADHRRRSTNDVNFIVIDKPPQLQWLDVAAAGEHCARGASIWRWASNADGGAEPDVILAAAADVPTLAVIPAAASLRRHLPDMRVRVVNVVDLMTLFPRAAHPQDGIYWPLEALTGRSTTSDGSAGSVTIRNRCRSWAES